MSEHSRTTLEPRDSEPRPRLRRPITVLLTVAVSLTLAAQTTSLAMGWSVMPAKILELVLLFGGACVITARTRGRRELRRLLGGLTRWRIGIATAIVVLAAMPALTVGAAAVTGTLKDPQGGWVQVLLLYLLFLLFGAITGNLWEETVWAGFVQAPLMARHGLLVGSLLTAVPFFVIHLPLAFETDGWPGTPWHDALITWVILLVSAPIFRYLIGMILLDTRGSLLAAGLLHASFNASGALPVLAGGWQYIPAMIALTLICAVRHHRRVSRTVTPVA
jgi:membrane protease YdiL (CAAX protease family)